MKARIRWRRWAHRAAQRARAWGRLLHVLPYQPECRTTEQWTAAYQAGVLSYYGRLDELARYSVIVGYLDWFAGLAAARRPTVLDVGCGTGLLRERLEGVDFAEYVGVDLSVAAVAEARSRAHPRSHFFVGDVATLDLGRFDVVVLNEVLYYVPDAAAFLARIRALLAPGGVLLVSMWRHPGDRSLWRKVDQAFPIVDRVEVRNRGNPINARGWLIGACRARSTATSSGDERR